MRICTHGASLESHASCSLFHRRGRRQGGFSLLEVVVAFAILALSLGILIQVFSRALNATALSGDYSRAATLVEARLNAIGIDIPLEPGSYAGDPEDGLSWKVFIEPYAPDDGAWEPMLDAFLVTSVVSWDEGGDKRHQVSLSSLRLAASSETADPGSDQDSALPAFPKNALGR